MRSIMTPALAILSLVVLVGASGCSKPKPRPRAFDVNVEMGPTLQGSTAGVHLVGVNSADKARWESEAMSQYWNSELRRSAESRGIVFPMEFGPGSSLQNLPVSDPIWQRWMASDAMWLFLLGDLPGQHTDMPGSADSRRAILPLDRGKWPREMTTINVTLERGGLFVSDSPLE